MKTLRESGVYQAVWPRGRVSRKPVRLAKRLDTLENKTVGFLWNGIRRGAEMFPMIDKELAKRYPSIKIEYSESFGITHGGWERQVLADLPLKLKQKNCDAVISAVGL